jgi:hypothetical protein
VVVHQTTRRLTTLILLNFLISEEGVGVGDWGGIECLFVTIRQRHVASD